MMHNDAESEKNTSCKRVNRVSDLGQIGLGPNCWGEGRSNGKLRRRRRRWTKNDIDDKSVVILGLQNVFRCGEQVDDISQRKIKWRYRETPAERLVRTDEV